MTRLSTSFDPSERAITFRQLRYFLAVAEFLHFRKAAQYLHRTQPALTLQIRALEEELGVALLERNTQKTTLTYAGAVLRDEARELFASVERAAERTARAAHGKVALLRVGFISTAVAAQIMPRLVSRFRQSHPQVELQLRSLLTAAQISMLQNHTLDVGFFRYPITEHEQIQTIPIFREPLVVLLPATHSLAHKPELRLEDLRTSPFIMYARQSAPGYHDSIMRMLNEAGFNPMVAQETGEMYTLVSLVSAGMGVAIAPLSVRGYRLPGIVTRKLPGLSAAVVAIGFRRHNENADALAFIKLALKLHRASAQKPAQKVGSQ
jgi:DNA-binding transcriptional LysR family regulator